MFHDALEVLVVIFLLVVVVPYVLGPILIFTIQRFRVPPNIVPLAPVTDPLPMEARQYFSEVFTTLTREGFELEGTMGLLDVVPNVQCILALYVQRRTGDQAMSTLIVANAAGAATLKTRYVEFVTRFDDGTVVQTNNSREMSSFPKLSNEHTAKFWEIQDVRRLYQLHRLLLPRFARSRRPVLLLDRDFGGDAVAYVSKVALEDDFAKQVSTGYLRRCPQGFAPTIKGAVLMTWQELWPFKAIRRARCLRAANALLAEVGLQLDAQ